MLKKVLKRVPPLKRGLKKLPKRVKRSKKRPKELVSQESAQESGSFKIEGRSKEFATHKSELFKKLLKQVPLFKKLNQCPPTDNQNKIITRTVFPMLSLFYDLEKTSIA